MSVYFNPGCALSLYKPEMEGKLLGLLRKELGEVLPHTVCCHHDPALEAGSMIINVCAGCDRRFRTLYEGITTVSLWEVLCRVEAFPFPDYHGARMTIHDACPVRDRPPVHQAVRALLRKMRVEVVEAEAHGVRSVCCGDSFYGSLPIDEIHGQMKKRADAMPCEDVVVYCVSCVKAMHIGGKTPRYLLDLLFGDCTEPKETDMVTWHDQLDEYIEAH